MREQAGLEAVREGVLGVVEPGPREGLGDEARQGGEHGPLGPGKGRGRAYERIREPTGRPEAISGRNAQAERSA